MTSFDPLAGRVRASAADLRAVDSEAAAALDALAKGDALTPALRSASRACGKAVVAADTAAAALEAVSAEPLPGTDPPEPEPEGPEPGRPDEPDDPKTGNLPTVEIAMGGTFHFVGGIDKPHDSDFGPWLRLAASGRASITLSGGDPSSELYLYKRDPDGSQGARVDTTAGTPGRIIVRDLTKEDYIAGVYSPSGVGKPWSVEVKLAPSVTVIPPPVDGSTGVNPDRDILCRDRDAFDRAYDAYGRDHTKQLVLPRGELRNWRRGRDGAFLTLRKGGTKDRRMVIRAETPGETLAKDGFRLAISGASDIDVRDITYDRTKNPARDLGGTPDKWGHGWCLLVHDGRDIRVSGVTVKGAQGGVKWAHAVTVSGRSDGVLFEDLAIIDMPGCSGCGTVGMEPSNVTYRRTLLDNIGASFDRECLAIQFNQDPQGDPERRTGPAYRNAGLVFEDGLVRALRGFNQTKMGGGVFRDSLLIADPNDNQPFLVLRNGIESAVEGCYLQGLYGVDVYGYRHRVLACLIIDPRYMGVRMWRGSITGGNNKMPPAQECRVAGNAIVNTDPVKQPWMIGCDDAGSAYRNIWGKNDIDGNLLCTAKRGWTGVDRAKMAPSDNLRPNNVLTSLQDGKIGIETLTVEGPRGVRVPIKVPVHKGGLPIAPDAPWLKTVERLRRAA